MVQLTLFSVFGSALYKKLAAALLYLYFLIPSGDYLIPSLQVLTAWFTVKGLHILGVPVYENGLVIAIPAGNFAVAEACAGLRFLIASVAFGVFFAIVTYRSLFRRLVFIACSIAMPLIANGLRVLGLILLAQWLGNPAEALADHVLYGWIFFSLVLIALVVFGQLLSDRHTTNAAIYPEANRSKLLPMPWPQMAVVGVSCFLAASVGSIAGSFLNLSHALNVPDAAPRVALPWRTIDAPTAWHPIVVGATRSFLRTFAQGPQKIDFFVALYGKQGGKTNLVHSINRDADEKIWRFSSEGSQAFILQGRIVPVRETTWSDGTDKRIVWSFFVVDGRPASSIWAAKFDELYGFLTNNSCASAYIAISMILHNAQDDKVMAEQIVAASEPLSTYLCKSTKTK